VVLCAVRFVSALGHGDCREIVRVELYRRGGERVWCVVVDGYLMLEVRFAAILDGAALSRPWQM
jgi:hypothetical protein